jgi:hypothetical protein
LGSTEASLSRFQESEVIHGRWAMLGVAGALAVEILGLGNWFDAPLWVSQMKPLAALYTLDLDWRCRRQYRLLFSCCK